MGKRIVIKTPAARSNSSEGTRNGIPGLRPRGLQQDSDISGSDVESLAVTSEPGSENGEGSHVSHVSERNSAFSDSQSSQKGKGGNGKGKDKGRRTKGNDFTFSEVVNNDLSPETQAMLLKVDPNKVLALISKGTAMLAERIVAEDKDAAQAFVRCLSSKAEGYTALTLKSVGVPAEQMARTQINSVLNLAAKILELDGVSVIIKAVTLLFSFLPGVTLASLNEIRSKDPHPIGAGLTTVCLAAELFETDSV